MQEAENKVHQRKMLVVGDSLMLRTEKRKKVKDGEILVNRILDRRESISKLDPSDRHVHVKVDVEVIFWEWNWIFSTSFGIWVAMTLKTFTWHLEFDFPHLLLEDQYTQ